MDAMIRWSVLTVAFSLLAVPAAAQDALTERFSLDAFEPATPDAAILGARTAAVPKHLGSEVGVTLNYANQPLAARIVLDGEERREVLVAGRTTAHLGYTFGLFDLLALDAALPFILGQSGPGLSADPRDGVAGEIDAFAIGDMTLGLRVQPLSAGPLQLAVGARIWLPTGANDGLVSDGVVRGEPYATVDVALGPVLAAVDLGYKIRGQRLAHNFRSDDAFTWGVGLRWNAVAALDVEASVRGAISPFDAPTVEDAIRDDNGLPYPIEALGGLAWDFGNLRVNAAAGPGLNAAVGNPKWRALVGVAYALDPTPTYGLATPSELLDGDEAQRGEDGGGFDFGALCPDGECAVPDSDGDGIPDDVDLCPNEPEDFDGFEDEDGCPDPDNDGDGIPDSEDECPNEPETVNGYRDEDGCPDEIDIDINVEARRIDVREAVYFDTDRATISQRSIALLQRVAKVLKDHPELTKVSIEGHTDSRGSDRHNLDLSARRAEAVRQFFIAEGIDAARLTATGFGESHPVADNNTEEGRAENRRVEFLIIERED